MAAGINTEEYVTPNDVTATTSLKQTVAEYGKEEQKYQEDLEATLAQSNPGEALNQTAEELGLDRPVVRQDPVELATDIYANDLIGSGVQKFQELQAPTISNSAVTEPAINLEGVNVYPVAQEMTSGSVADNLLNYFASAEGVHGGDSVTNVKTYAYGITRPSSPRQPGESGRDWAKRILQKDYLSKLEKYEGYQKAPMGVKMMMGSWAWNAGPGGVIKRLKELSKYAGDPAVFQQKLKETVFSRLQYVTARVASKGNIRHVVGGLGVRVAKDYNFAARSLGMPTIKRVEMVPTGSYTRINYLDEHGQAIYSFTSSHPYAGGKGRYTVPQPLS